MVMTEQTTIEAMIERAREAMSEIENYTQEETDHMVYAVAKTVVEHSEELGKLAYEDTKMGSAEQQQGYVEFIGAAVYAQMIGKKSVGEIERDEELGIIKIAHPGGVVANVLPVTTPVMGPLSNTLNALKGRNAIINAPAPAAKRSNDRVTEIMREALKKVGAPEDLVQAIAEPSLESSQEVMEKSDIVIGTGGPSIVKAAYSSGTPAYGVGAGNAQLLLDETDDLEKFVEDAITGRLANFATGCNCTQTLHYKSDEEQKIKDAFTAQGAFWIEDEETIDKLRNIIFDEEGRANREVSGQPLSVLVEKAGIEVPEDATILITKTNGSAEEEILTHEKPVPVLNARPYDAFEDAVRSAAKNLVASGTGHSSAIYSTDEDKINQASNALKVSRLLVNQPTYHSAGGANNNMPTTVTQGNGYWGGNVSNDLLEYKHLLNIQRVILPRNRKQIPADIWEKEI